MQDFLARTSEPGKEALDWVQDKLMASCEKAEDNELPQTGMPPEVEKAFSSIFIQPLEFQGKLYGTHTQSVITARANGRVEFSERAMYRKEECPNSDTPRTSAYSLIIPITDSWQST